MRASEFITESNAQAWIDKIYSQFQDWPYGRGDKVMVWGSGDDQQFAVFALKPVLGREDIVDVDWFQAHPQRQGVGSRAMAKLQQLAQADGIKLKLFPWDKGQVSQTALKRFYKRAGFKPIAPGATSMQWEPDLDEYINKSILKPGWKDTQSILDGQYRLEAEVKEWANKPTLVIKVYDDQATDWEGNPKPKEAGYTRFVSRGMFFKDLVASMVYVNPEYRRQGIASAMYKYAHGLGNSIKPSTAQLTPGKELWKGIKTKGGIDKLEEEPLDEGLRDWIAATGATSMQWAPTLNEAREAPLYHFTSEDNFFRILSTDTLLGRGKIYFTRDYGRQFIPREILAGSWGFRVNQDMLRRDYGKKLVAGGQDSGWTEKKRQAWLADPANADTIAKVKAGQPSNLSIGGVSVNDIIAGTIGSAGRWESEEHLLVSQVPNFHKYITGLVYVGGKHVGQYEHGTDFKKRNPRPQEALDELSQYLMGHFTGDAGFKKRDGLMDYMTKFNIPFVYQQQDFPAKTVKSRMIELWRERKAERARRAQEVKNYFTVIKNKEGGGLSISAPTAEIAVERALKEFPHKFPDGVLGVREDDKETVWFDQPKFPQEVLDEGLRDWIAALAATGAMVFGSPADAAKAQQLATANPQAVEQVSAIMAKPIAQVLKKTAVKAGITGTELAQFMAQCAHETANFSTLKEIGGKLDFKKYDPKYAPKKAKALGNTKAGDGAKYAGRGFIQLTGRDNYKRAGQALGLPLEQQPELVERPDVAAQVAVWFWQNRVAPKVASFHDTKQVTKPINPGMRGLQDRHTKFSAIKQGALATPKDMAPRGRRI